MKVIKQVYRIHAPVDEVWKAMVSPRHIQAWGGGPAKMTDKVGQSFSIWGGDVHGRNTEVIPHKKLVQEWYYGEWKEPSIATFMLHAQGVNTRIDFVHENVPDADAKDIAQGWKEFYLGPLKKYVEDKGGR